jgi:hypothetical protein
LLKFTVLAECVRHHIKEEEGEKLPKVKSLKIDFEELGRQMLERKKILTSGGTPEDAEHVMVMSVRGKRIHPRQLRDDDARRSNRAF